MVIWGRTFQISGSLENSLGKFSKKRNLGTYQIPLQNLRGVYFLNFRKFPPHGNLGNFPKTLGNFLDDWKFGELPWEIWGTSQVSGNLGNSLGKFPKFPILPFLLTAVGFSIYVSACFNTFWYSFLFILLDSTHKNLFVLKAKTNTSFYFSFNTHE